MKKKIITSFLIISIFTGGLQVYASSVLDTNIIGLIKSGFAIIQEYFIDNTNEQIQETKTNNTVNLENYISGLTNQKIKNIEVHIDGEINRANTELDSYVNKIKTELDSIMTGEEKKINEQISKKVTHGISSIKKDLDKDLEKYIKQYVKK